MVGTTLVPTMRFSGCLALFLLGGALAVLAAPAQTYTPRQIRFNGGGDPKELLKLSGLEPGKPLTKAQIEAAMGRLADTGAFTDLSYTVNGEALVIKLTGAAEAPGQALPVRWANFAWWQPDELTGLVEHRVPLFHGELPLTGTLTDQVRAAAVQLLAEKGVPNAKVEAMTSTLGGSGRGIGSLSLAITQPEIRLGTLTLTGAVPSTQKQLDVVSGKLSMQDWESDVTAKAIRDNVADTEKNAGYLDADVDPPSFSIPRKDMNGYAVDAAAVVHPGDLYRIASLDFDSKATVTQADSAKASGLKVDQPAGAMDMEIGRGRLQRTYESRGYLDAVVEMQTELERAQHTVALRFTAKPGELYHLASVDTNSLPAAMQTAFAREFQGRSGMQAGQPLETEILRTLRAINAPASTVIEMRRNRAAHTVVVVVTLGRGRPDSHPPLP